MNEYSYLEADLSGFPLSPSGALPHVEAGPLQHVLQVEVPHWVGKPWDSEDGTTWIAVPNTLHVCRQAEFRVQI